jgi:hypothetical protein
LFGICDLGQNNEQEEKKGAVGEGKKVGGRRGEERRRERGEGFVVVWGEISQKKRAM